MSQTVTKIFKNESGADKIIFNQIVPDGGSYNVPQRYWADGPSDDNIIADITSGDIVINDGTADLSVADALEWLERWQQDDAVDIPYDNSVSGSVAENLQEAVDGILVDSLGGIYTMVFAEDGPAKNKWLNSVHNNVLSNQSPHVFLWRSKLIGITFTNSKNGADTTVKLYKAAEDDGNSPLTNILSWNLVNCRVARKTNFASSIICDAGDKLAIFLSDQGTDAKDVVVTCYWKVLAPNEEEHCEDYSGDFSLSGGTTSSRHH